MALINGYDGAFKIGAGSTAVGYLTEVSVEIDQEVKKQGPFVGNSTISKVRGGKDAKGSAKGYMVSPIDSGQALVLSNIDGGTNVQLVLEVGNPALKTLTIATAIIGNVKFGPKADEGVPISFDFEASGGYTLT